MKAMIEIVNQCLRDYVGGTKFFDELDKAVKYNEEIIDELMYFTYDEYDAPEYIASGEFGLCLNNYGYGIEVLVPGGLRKTKTIPDLSQFVIADHEYLFLDDSHFSGTTMQVVKEEVERCGGIWLGSCVIYDGSHEKDDNIKSLYRYYDHYDILGRLIEKNEESC